MNKKISIIIFIGLIFLAGAWLVSRFGQFPLPNGETTVFVEEARLEPREVQVPVESGEAGEFGQEMEEDVSKGVLDKTMRVHAREIFITDGVKHSIPLGEILSGGPPKDGIPSIDEPKFISTSQADEFLADTDIGLGLVVNGEVRFYPYQILVWHEIVNDEIAGVPVLVTYCPLCRTGVVFDRRVSDQVQEFGVSGKLWQSNLLMYNRADSTEDESLWSQVLGEAVLGVDTGDKLSIVTSDTVRYGDWKSKHADTLVLSKDTGAFRSYGADPYGDYYTDNSAVSFGAEFTDNRLQAKDFVLGVEVGGKFKAYLVSAIPDGKSIDEFAGEVISLEKSDIGEVRMKISGAELPYIGGFWFSWVAVHTDTEVYK